MPVDPQQHRTCTGLFNMRHARLHSPSETTSRRSHACMTIPVVFVITILTLPVIAARVAMEIEHASSHSDNMQSTILQPANNVQPWRPLADGFEARSIGSYCVLLLLMSGDVSINPGPTRYRNYKHPCITCQKPVKNNQAGLQCDAWSHLRCLPDAIRITKDDYNRLSRTDENWYCYQCQLPTFTDSFFSPTSP